jgi:DNA repair protein RadC
VREAPAPQSTANEAGANCGCPPTDPLFIALLQRAGKKKFKTPREVYALISPDCAGKPFEEFFVLGLGAHGEFEGRPMVYSRVAQGGQHKVEVEIERIAQVLLGRPDGRYPDIYVLAHSHPSHDATPSNADVTLTKNIREGLSKSCPRIIWGDHLVICDREFYSFAEGRKTRVV